MNYNRNRVKRILSETEVVQAGHLILWHSKNDAWTKIDPGSVFVGLPVATLRVRHGQPDLQFGELMSFDEYSETL